MKKLSLLLAGIIFIFAACNNATTTEDQNANVNQTDSTRKCCKEMTEEEKAFKAEWNNWDNLAEEKKVELVAKAKAMLDEKKAKCEAKKAECEAKLAAMSAEDKAKCEAKKAECEAKLAAMSAEDKAKCEAAKAEKEIKKAELDAKLAAWETLSIDDQKSLIDELSKCCEHKCCKKGEKAGCCKGQKGGEEHKDCGNKN